MRSMATKKAMQDTAVAVDCIDGVVGGDESVDQVDQADAYRSSDVFPPFCPPVYCALRFARASLWGASGVFALLCLGLAGESLD